jgi:hypothetical protein
MSEDNSGSESSQTKDDSIASEIGTPVAENDYGDFPPGTIVLAKLKSFPPWPAIVIPFELIPEGVVSSKPKNPPRSLSTRSKRRSVQQKEVDPRLWCVRFLRDDTFMWATSNDISLLTKEQIEHFLKSKKAKKVIRSAYEMALDPPDVEEFIVYGSDGKPIDIDNEANDADFEEESGNGYEDEDDDDEDEDDEDEDEDLEVEGIKKRKRLLSKRSSPKKKSKISKPKANVKRGRKSTQIPVQDPDTSSDEDWDVENDGEEPVAVDVLTSDEISAIIKKTQPIFLRAKLLLQKALLSGKEIDNNLKPVITSTESLEKIDSPHLGIVKQTGLHKVLFDILKRPDLTTRDLKKIRNRLENLVQEWFDVKIDTDEAWDFIERDEEPVDTTDIKTENSTVEPEDITRTSESEWKT